MAVLFLPLVSWAQEYNYKGEVFGSVGWGRLFGNQGSVGTNVNLGGGIGIRPFRKLGFEFEVNRMNQRALGQQRFNLETIVLHSEGTATYFTGNLVYHFSTSRVQPYLLVGAGGVHYDGRIRVRPLNLGPELVVEEADTGFAFNFGGGAKIFLHRKLSLRPEFRFFAAGPGVTVVNTRLSKIRLSVGLAYHW